MIDFYLYVALACGTWILVWPNACAWARADFARATEIRLLIEGLFAAASVATALFSKFVLGEAIYLSLSLRSPIPVLIALVPALGSTWFAIVTVSKVSIALERLKLLRRNLFLS